MTDDEHNKDTDDVTFETELDSDSASSLGGSAFGGKDPMEMITSLKEKLKLAQKEAGENLDGWQRAKADFVNAKKREEEERGEFVKFSKRELIKELLPALDSFHTAFGNKEAWEKVDLNWRMGVQYIYSQLLGSLEKHGITLIDPKVGEPFDPAKHASIESVPTANKAEDHTVHSVVQKGYALHGKILEPAKVKIAEYHG